MNNDLRIYMTCHGTKTSFSTIKLVFEYIEKNYKDHVQMVDCEMERLPEDKKGFVAFTYSSETGMAGITARQTTEKTLVGVGYRKVSAVKFLSVVRNTLGMEDLLYTLSSLDGVTPEETLPMEEEEIPEPPYQIPDNIDYTHTFSEDFEKYTTNITEDAKQGKISPVIGREKEIDMVIKTLSRKQKNNPLLLGESGVGKTTIAEGLALKFIQKEANVPVKFQNTQVISLNISAIMAGARYRGDTEERVLLVVEECAQHGNVILFIDEIHGMVGAGKGESNNMDIGGILKPHLTTGAIRVMGATTNKEYKNKFAKDPALPRRFQNIAIEEPTVEDTNKILLAIRGSYEDHHGVKISTDLVEQLVVKSDKFVKGNLPDKAIDIMDLAMTEASLKGDDEVLPQDVDKIVANVARIPTDAVSSSEKKELQTLKGKLVKKVLGQDHVIDKVVETLQINRAGLTDDNKPVGSFLFTGPTGTGKTELTQSLAEVMGYNILRLDMSEYQDKHAASKLIGTVAGYVGYEDGGIMTDYVANHPRSIVLLDEIEKADPSIFKIFLQIMDNGSITDGQGESVDFRNVILVMTTNTGASAVEDTKSPMGFLGNVAEAKKTTQDKALKDMFAPEFRNRLDSIVMFNNLEKDVIGGIAKKFINEVMDKVKDKKITLEVTEEALAYFVEHGFDKAMGARPMKRLVSEKIKKPLAAEILFGDAEGKDLILTVNDGEVKLKENVKI